MEVIQALQALERQAMFVTGIHLDQFHGIEIDDFACEIARLSLWLAEHQLNNQWQKVFGSAPPTLPLSSTGRIVHENSLTVDWLIVCPKLAEDEVYVIGNPPFLGTLGRTEDQRSNMHSLFSDFDALNKLDFVACWFWKAGQYIQSSKAEMALVATNSICQGESVATLWPRLFSLGLSIHIAYQTFPWANNARDKAAVHVVIVGLSAQPKIKLLFQEISGYWHSSSVGNISPYLVEGSNIAVATRTVPLAKGIRSLLNGNKPSDGGNLLLNRSERDELLRLEPKAEKWIKPFLGADEFLNSKERWCLWLNNASDEELVEMPEVQKRLSAVRKVRMAGGASAQKMVDKPHVFVFVSQPRDGSYILIPRVSSERRTYVPMGFLDSDVITSDRNFILPNGTLYRVWDSHIYHT